MSDSILAADGDEIIYKLKASGTLDLVANEAHSLGMGVKRRIRRNFDKKSADVLMLVVDIKMAFLQRMRLHDWTDMPPPHALTEILNKHRSGATVLS